jgi:hypothetical protein
MASYRVNFPIDTSFTPEEIHCLGVAFANTCAVLNTASESQLDREYIAACIISIALAGERDPINIYLQCLQELRSRGSAGLPHDLAL